MKRGLFFFFGLCITGLVYAQPSGPSGFDANANLANATTSGFRTFDNRYAGVKGGSSVFEDFVYGNVNMADGERALGQELNYDVITKELIVRSRIYKRVLAVRRDLVSSFELISADGDTLTFKKVTDKGYEQKVYEGKAINIYYHRTKQLVKAAFGGAYNANAKNYDEFVEANTFLISANGEPLEEIKPTRKAFEKKFPDKKALISAYYKENKVDLKKPKDMAAFVAYLDKN